MKHEWFRPGENGYPHLAEYGDCCKKCGVIRQANGSSDERECRGVARIVPRELASIEEEVDEYEAAHPFIQEPKKPE